MTLQQGALENREELGSEWLDFVKGVVQSADTSVNISRGTLQRNKMLQVVRCPDSCRLEAVGVNDEFISLKEYDNRIERANNISTSQVRMLQSWPAAVCFPV